MTVANTENKLRNEVLLIKNTFLQSPKADYKTIFKKTNINFRILHIHGQVLFDSSNLDLLEKTKNLKVKREVLNPLKNKEGMTIRGSNTLGEQMFYYTLFLNKNHIIEVSTQANSALNHFRVLIGLQILLILLLDISAFLSYRYFFSRNLLDKIDQIKNVLKKGDSFKNFSPPKDPWISQFFIIIKEWQEQNLKNIESLNLEKLKLKTIIASVDVEILLLDSKKRLKLRNQALPYLYDESNQNSYSSLIKYKEVIDFISKFKKGKNRGGRRKEIFIEEINKFIIIKGLYLSKRKEFLFFIKDITMTKESINIQKTFITNLGHELKTPLTSIKGYLIALKEVEDQKMKEQFIEILLRNTDKLNHTIQDFLSLSKIERFKTTTKVKTTFKEIQEELTTTLSSIIKSKKAVINYYSNVETLMIDREKIVIILKNLIENSLIYSSSTPIITVTLTGYKDQYKISVEDNGIGISLEDQDKIFNPFFRVDKARTTNEGGSGLGLSIVKELLDILGGEVVLNSSSNGTNITITI